MMLLCRLLRHSAVLVTLTVLAGWMPCVQAADNAELAALLGRALSANPRVLAARHQVEQALDRHEELLGFFDPRLYAAGGKAERSRGVPGGSGWTALTTNAHEVMAGIEVPVRPGAYLSAGAAERFLFDGGDYDHLYQTLLGVRLRVPLWRDRGFAQHDLARARALADYNGAVSDLITVMQTVRREVEKAYIDAYATLASQEVSKRALERFQVLLDQARELSRLKVVPAYQVFPTEMEIALRLEEEEQARQVHVNSLIALQKTIGDGQPVALAYGPEHLVEIATGLGDLLPVDTDDALQRRGSFLRLLNHIEAARAELALALDDRQPDLSLNAALTVRGESADQPLGWRSHRDDELLGGEVVVVWERPLQYRAVDSRVSRLRGRVAELKEHLQTERTALLAEVQSAMEAYTSLSGRLRLLEQAKDAARQTVSAEDERFRLGEGTSRNALDAQKDLTTVLNRQASAAAAILRALADYHYAAGYADVAAP